MKTIRSPWFQYAVMVLGLAALVAVGSTILDQRGKRGKRRSRGELYTSPVAAIDPSARPNVILMVLDATRRDALSPYGRVADGSTPNIARLARRGVVFDAGYSAAAFSGPSYASLLTGRYPPGHGVFNHPNVLTDRSRTLLEIASDAGFYTLFFTEHSYLRKRWQYDRGAFHYRFDDPDVLVEDLTSWMSGHPEVPFVAFMAITTPHYPYGLENKELDLYQGLSLRDRVLHRVFDPRKRMFDFASTGLSDEYAEAQRQSYLREVERADLLVGRVMDAVESAGPERDTVIIVTADHGEAFGEHGHYFGHDPVVYAPVTGVPLIITWPGRLAPARVEAPVSLVDVLPTLAEWFGGDVEHDLDGRSLVAMLDGEGDPPDRALFSFNRALSRKVREKYSPVGERYQLDSYEGCSFLGVRGRWDVVMQPLTIGFAYEVFERAADPLHLEDMWAVHGDDAEVQQLVGDLHAYRNLFLSEAMPNEKPLSDEQREELRALGYVE